MKLYRVQDSDRPCYVVAEDWQDAVNRWTRRMMRENDTSGPDDIETPSGVEYLGDCGGDFPEVLLADNPDPRAARVEAVKRQEANIAIRQLFDDVIQECWRVAFRNGYYHGEDAANFERAEADDLRAASMESYANYCDSEDAWDVEDEQLNAVLALLAADPPGATVEIVCACGHVAEQHYPSHLAVHLVRRDHTPEQQAAEIARQDAEAARIRCHDANNDLGCPCPQFTPTTARVTSERALTEEERNR